jgi:hypothetical protein
MVDWRGSRSRALLVLGALSMFGCGGVSVSGGEQASNDDDASGGVSGAGSAAVSSSGLSGGTTGGTGGVNGHEGSRGGSVGVGGMPSNAGSAGSGAEGGSNGGAEGGSVGGATPSGGMPAVTECLVVYPNLGLTDCERLGRYASVHDAVISDANGDGHASPGERITISVTLSEVTGETFIPYPGIDFQALDSGITLDRSGFDGASVYSLQPCESIGGSVAATLSGALTPGSVVHVTAQAATLNQDCPSAIKLTIPIAIE